ncbi:hypothetical protein EI42_05216 [Thermosporothrix hazakensis]|jgi:hypothetical protein|uniref:Uncharacterized protein n=1 Tax=Thermosporothrix hazakensis TaxID=644383 RepID=A0A326TZQ6_THEHA|nr:hypothetical protein [Thermosporothrix hazakensis]PZW23003.1 hypothetical protein EI42_05216 [Thermosporothrix hazakensis]GCE48314.1 hypothetical protein KTH_31830 [Thermosporothrix hazakensis]
MTQNSKVTRLLAQISEEYEAAQRGLTGLAQGTSQHTFITKRMERIADLHSHLRELVGEEAMALIVKQLEGQHEQRKNTR